MDELPLKTGPLRGPLRKRDSHLWRRHAEDYYVEPQWCSERLFEMERFKEPIWDPACGSGRIVRAAVKAGYLAIGTDIKKRFPDAFLEQDFFESERTGADIVCNPPFGEAERFVSRAINITSGKIAMLLPANWIQGDRRSRWLEGTPLARVLFITPRPSMPPGPVIEAGGKPGSGTTDYAWFIWDHSYKGAPTIGWLRKREDRGRRLI